MKNFPILLCGLFLLFLLCHCKKEHPSQEHTSRPIIISTIEYLNLTPTSVDVKGLITGGPDNIIAIGVCWAIHSDVRISDNKTTDGGMRSFICSIKGLSPFTKYYFRTYAQTLNDTIYGNEIQVVTPMAIPVVTTNLMTGIFTFNGTVTGTVTYSGGGPIDSIGFCWSNVPNPTVSDNSFKIPGPKYQSPYLSPIAIEGLISGLTSNTTYYLKAFAKNKGGTGYGNQIIFTTNSEDIPAQDYLPLQIGNYWEFSDGRYVNSILIDKTENLNGVDYFRLIRKLKQPYYIPTDTVYLRKTPNGIVYERRKTPTSETVLFYLSGSTGEVWFNNTNQQVPFYGKLSNKSDSVKRNSVVFNNCLFYEYYPGANDPGTVKKWDYWLAPNVGFVKYLGVTPIYYAARLTKSIINGVEQTY